MPNGINDISPDLRDWLLNKNLILSDSVTNGGLAPLGVGLGQVGKIETLPNAVQSSTSIVENGQFYRDLNLLVNPYKSITENHEFNVNTNTVINIGNLPVGTQPLEYTNTIGSENEHSDFNILADSGREQLSKNKYFDASLIYKVNLNTISVSKTNNGVYEFKQSLLSRTVDNLLNATNLGGVSQQLGTVGADSDMGTIADKQLVKHFGYKAAFGASKETLGHINLNPLSLLQGNDIIVPSYQITIPKGQLGTAIDFAARVLGFESPVSLLEGSSSIFAKENPVDNIARVESMVLNTGKGQILSLIDNINQNKYKPTITDDRKRENITKGDTGTNGDLYAFESLEAGRILDLLNTPPLSVKSENQAFIGGTPNPAFLGDVANQNLDKVFEGENGKITSELDGGFNDEFADFGAVTRGDNYDGFGWKDTNNNNEGEFRVDDYNKVFKDKPNGLLYKTKQLFNTNRMRTLVSGHGVHNQKDSETQNTVRGYMSKGSGVLSSDILQSNDNTAIPPENTFCRTWTTFDRYDNIYDLQKSSGLFLEAGSTIRKNTEHSVLDDNGFARIAPKVGDNNVVNGSTMNRFMFSLENLAWTGFEPFLPDCEKGPGDPVTGTQGRIMWFPPYGMNFTDNSAVNWDTTNFIGRGEPIYTYNNTERTGTLQWQMIIDHATYINDLKGQGASDEVFASTAAGCMIPPEQTKLFTQVEKDATEIVERVIKKEIPVDPQIAPEPFKVYFPNDATAVVTDYENGDNFGLGVTKATPGYITNPNSYHGKNGYADTTDYGLNGCIGGPNAPECPEGSPVYIIPNSEEKYAGWYNNEYLPKLAEYLMTDCTACRIDISGYHSSDGASAADANQRLSNDRASNVQESLSKLMELAAVSSEIPIETPIASRFRKVKGEGLGTASEGCPKRVRENGRCVENCPEIKCKKEQRFTNVNFIYDATLDTRHKFVDEIIQEEVATKVINNVEIKQRYFNECAYFEKIEQDDKFIYKQIKDKVKYFHPSFHSMTPEGFNGRLNFLQQCTRQGPTIRSGVPSNLSFGTPPVCILRVGDFYHTKIVIDNLSFSFDPLVWDLNPEGVGVQPMICTVDMSFKFIGGSSLQGPINRLQNAVSFNFFGNTEIYDDRADSIKTSNDPLVLGKIVNGMNPNNFDSPSEEYRAQYNANTIKKVVPNQEDVAEKGSPNEEDESGSDTTEPKILIISDAQTKFINKVNNETLYSIRFRLELENMVNENGDFLSGFTDEKQEEFVNKGIKISLSSSQTNFFGGGAHEQIITIDEFQFINGWLYVTKSSQFDQDPFYLEQGVYELSISYDSTKVSSINIIANGGDWDSIT